MTSGGNTRGEKFRNQSGPRAVLACEDWKAMAEKTNRDPVRVCVSSNGKMAKKEKGQRAEGIENGSNGGGCAPWVDDSGGPGRPWRETSHALRFHQALKPSQAKWLASRGLGLGLGVSEAKAQGLSPGFTQSRCQAIVRLRKSTSAVFADASGWLPSGVTTHQIIAAKVVLKLLKEHQDFDGKPGLKPKPGQAKPPQLAWALAWGK
ncbi:hypothetical protein C8R45DRAFT_920229 [Mycena sanguinolenta]|nr:hypothetical protein C8R45DRAFT_920229 [Mycena sanguinolenta]